MSDKKYSDDKRRDASGDDDEMKSFYLITHHLSLITL